MKTFNVGLIGYGKMGKIYANEIKKKKQFKIVDILGKESQPNKKGLLFYIYSDGTVEKKLIIE